MIEFGDMIGNMYELHYDRLLGRAYHQLGDRYLAEDAVSEAFLHVMMHYRWWGEQPERRQQAYVDQACDAVCRLFLKKKQREKIGDCGRRITDEEDYEKLRLLEVWIMRDYLKLLSPLDQELFLERFFEGRSVRSIAAEHEMLENTVSQHLTRGKGRLRRAMDEI